MSQSVEERRAEKIAHWKEQLSHWDWFVIQETILERNKPFRLGKLRDLMAGGLRHEWKDYLAHEKWLEVYCFRAALREVASEKELQVYEPEEDVFEADVPGSPEERARHHEAIAVARANGAEVEHYRPLVRPAPLNRGQRYFPEEEPSASSAN